MNTIGQIEFKKIGRISPSQFYLMKNCPYRSLLANAFNQKPLLPISPSGYLGSVLHKVLELIAKGIVRNEEDFNLAFDEQVKIVELNLLERGYSFFIPLQKSVVNFGIKKILLKKHLRTTSYPSVKMSKMKFYSEKWFESKDKQIAGKIDLIIDYDRDIEIIDFKTGAVTENILDDIGEIHEIKEEYKDQLKLYAYLYFENTGKFPNKLSLVDLSKQKFTIDFSRAECYTIFEAAKELIHSTNESIHNQRFVANPSETNCKYCLYRPACCFFQEQLKTSHSFNDVTGQVSKVLIYKNGNVSVLLQNGKQFLTITNFTSEKYDEFKNKINQPISIYNLRKEPVEFIYSTTKQTMIYENN